MAEHSGIRILSCPNIWKSVLPQDFLQKFNTHLTVVLANEKNTFCNKMCLDCKLRMFKEYNSLIFTFTFSELWFHKSGVYLSLGLCCLCVGYTHQGSCLWGEAGSSSQGRGLTLICWIVCLEVLLTTAGVLETNWDQLIDGKSQVKCIVSLANEKCDWKPFSLTYRKICANKQQSINQPVNGCISTKWGWWLKGRWIMKTSSSKILNIDL